MTCQKLTHVAHFCWRHAIDFGNFTNCGAQGQGIVIGDLAGLATAITGKNKIDDVVALIPRKININVWGIMTARIEKTFKK